MKCGCVLYMRACVCDEKSSNDKEVAAKKEIKYQKKKKSCVRTATNQQSAS